MLSRPPLTAKPLRELTVSGLPPRICVIARISQRLRRPLKITAGVLLLVLGIVGLFLPFLQGILFIVMGLSLLSTESDRAKAWLHYLQRRVGTRKVIEPTRRTMEDR